MGSPKHMPKPFCLTIDSVGKSKVHGAGMYSALFKASARPLHYQRHTNFQISAAIGLAAQTGVVRTLITATHASVRLDTQEIAVRPL